MIAQDGAGDEQVRVAYHQAARQNAKGPFQRAHMDVHRKASYILACKKGGDEGDHGWIRGSQKLFHAFGDKGIPAHLSSRLTGR